MKTTTGWMTFAVLQESSVASIANKRDTLSPSNVTVTNVSANLVAYLVYIQTDRENCFQIYTACNHSVDGYNCSPN